MKRTVLVSAICLAVIPGFSQAPASAHSEAKTSTFPVTVTVLDRTRINSIQWFNATAASEVYGYSESLLRVGIAQNHRSMDWQLELAQPSVLELPKDAVSPVAAQGQLGLGGTYYVSNNNQTNSAAAALKQGFIRFHGSSSGRSLRIGRFEFVDGQETKPKNPDLLYLQTNRMAHRMIGNFGFSAAQRSFDGVEGHYGGHSWVMTGLAARADQGVFNMNANPELNVDIQYFAFTQSNFDDHLLWRVFAIDYHDGRTGLIKSDNRPLAARAADHRNIRIGSYGGDFLTSMQAGPGKLDILAWGVLQNGYWGVLNHRAGAIAIEGGYHVTGVRSSPWVRAGLLRSTGDSNPTDDQHNTYFQLLPTPRVYARFPFYNMMNGKDEFAQVMDNPTKKLDVRSDLHFLQLTSATDLWYQGGGAYDNKAFGYVGRPANYHSSFASIFDVSADFAVSNNIALSAFYAHVFGKSVIAAIYPTGHSAQYGYLEMTYRFGILQKPVK
ncbi:MAG: hypothetical protein NVS9B15_02030 [Acidobacteriaceae bacterium]